MFKLLAENKFMVMWRF